MGCHKIGFVMGGYIDENDKLMTREELNRRIKMKDDKIDELEKDLKMCKEILLQSVDGCPKRYADILKELDNKE
jgi:hypothetical protein